MNIDWRKTLLCFAVFLAGLGVIIWFTRPAGDDPGLLSNQPGAAPPSERLAAVFDGRTWTAGREVRQEGRYMIQYHPPGESPDNWRQSVTVQVFTGIQDKGTPEQFAREMEKHLRDWGGEKIAWSVLFANETEAVYEWSVTGKPETPDKLEIGRVVRGAAGLHLIQFAARATDQGPQTRSDWLDRLKAAKMEKIPSTADQSRP